MRIVRLIAGLSFFVTAGAHAAIVCSPPPTDDTQKAICDLRTAQAKQATRLTRLETGAISVSSIVGTYRMMRLALILSADNAGTSGYHKVATQNFPNTVLTLAKDGSYTSSGQGIVIDTLENSSGHDAVSRTSDSDAGSGTWTVNGRTVVLQPGGIVLLSAGGRLLLQSNEGPTDDGPNTADANVLQLFVKTSN
jgi:hypothetical protein